MLATIISLASGAVGGNLAGSAMKKYSMGTLWNSVAGILGGGLGSVVLGSIMPELGEAAASGSLDIQSILGSVAGGGVGGGIVMTVIGLIKQAMNK